MKTKYLFLGIFTFVVGAYAAEISDRYIVTVKNGAAASDVAVKHGISADRVYTKVANGFAGHIPPGQLKKLQDDADVDLIVPDREVSAIIGIEKAPSGSGKPGSGGGTPAGQVIPEGVKRIGAVGLAYRGTGVGVAVVDTGLDFNHADLVVSAVSYNAFSEGSLGQDNEGHGTHVGGIIAARDNTTGTIGVAPEAVLYAVKVLDQNGSGTDSTIIAGLDWIANTPVSPAIQVVNMSLGRQGSVDDNPILRAAIANLVSQGISVIVAAGNDSSLEVSQQVPATYPEVIAVASTSAKNGTVASARYRAIPADTASYFTTDGAYDLLSGIGVTVSAPGEDQENVSKAGFIQSVGILSTRLGGGTTRMSGTSMASPHVAGVAVLLYQQAQQSGLTLTPEDVRAKVMGGASGIDVAPLNSPTASYSFDGDREGVLSAPGSLSY